MAINYYRILGVRPDADPAAIKLAYRKLAKEMHPDRNQHDPFAQDLFKRVNEAYRTLSSPEARSRYDEGLSAPKAPQGHAKASPKVDVDSAVRDFAQQVETSLKALPFDWRELPGSHYLLLGLLTLVCVSQSFGAPTLTLMVWTYWLGYAALTSYWVNRLRVGDPAQDSRLWGSVLAVHLISLPITFVLSFPLVALLGYLNTTFGR